MSYPITTQKALRAAFWEACSDIRGVTRRKIRNYSGNGTMHNTDTRCAWCNYVDMMVRDGQISDALAQRATL